MADPTEKFVLEPRKIYEFTLNLDDKHQLMGSVDLRLVKALGLIRELFDTMNGDLYYNLRTEISMPQYGDKHTNYIPRIHYHGIIYIRDEEGVLNWLIRHAYMLTRIGRYQLNPYRPEYWPQYCKKHEKIFNNKTIVRNIKWSELIEKQAEAEETESK